MTNIQLAAAIGACGLTTTVFGQSTELDPAGDAPARYTVTRLWNLPGGTASYPAAVSAAGEVAGTAYDSGTCSAGCPSFGPARRRSCWANWRISSTAMSTA